MLGLSSTSGPLPVLFPFLCMGAVIIPPLLQMRKRRPRTSLVVQWLQFRLPMQGVRVRSLVGELRSHMPQPKNQNIKQKQYCNKFGLPWWHSG